jgi:aspartyl-tRNA synthetase
MKIDGWCEELRNLGGIKFIKLHTISGDVQITLPKKKVSKELFDSADKITRQSAISVTGTLKKNKEAPGGEEIIPEKIEIINLAETPLPLEPSEKTPANLDTRLDWRPLDLRRLENLAIFRIQAKVVECMTEYLKKEGFLQVFTPCLLGGASEGGADVFQVMYFNKQAYLRQDPQLHRELLILGGFGKIFDIGPSWRAELSHTPRHLCEHRGIAVELSFIKDEGATEKVEEEMIVYALKKVKRDCKKELKLLGKKIDIPKLPFPELRFPKIYEILEEFGKKIPFGEDYDKESEELLAKYVKEKYKSDLFFINRFPFKVKPFYVMRVDDEPEWARSVDLIFKGMEQSSGGQREHRYEKIIQQLREKKINVESMEWFTNHFKYGAPPMGGFCLGLERFTMQLLDIKNIKEVVLFPRTPERLLP